MTLPPSRARWIDPFVFAATAAATYVVGRRFAISTTGLAIVLIAAVTTVMCALEVRHAPWAKRARRAARFPEVARRAFVPWLETVAGIVAVALAWALVPESRRGFYQPWYDVGRALLPFAPIVTAAFVLLTEWRLGPADGKPTRIEWALGWFTKGFFFPLTFSELVHKLDTFRATDAWTLSMPWPVTVDRIETMLFATLLVAIAPGYLFSTRLFGNELKRVDATLSGWAVTLLCYPPFNAFPPSYQYPIADRLPWALWSSGRVAYALGIALLLLELVHCWGEATFGLRSSNLSNRGVITSGPYRFCKHPVYVVKCLAWLLLWAPLQSGWTPAARARWLVVFASWCAVYVARGWVEERMLSADPEYVAYARWIDEHGALRWIGHWVPFLRYEWRLRRWTAGNESCGAPQDSLRSGGSAAPTP